MPLHEVVQLFALSGKAAVIDIAFRDGVTGSLVVEGGQVLYAEIGSQTGEDAAFALLAQRSGVFRAHVGCTSELRNVDRDLRFLLLEAARREDEDSVWCEHKDTAPDDITLVDWPEHPFMSFFSEAGVAPSTEQPSVAE